MDDSKTKIQAFLDYLESHCHDRGIMADLRHGFSPGTEYRAWPHVAPWCDLTDQRRKSIFITIAGAFATQSHSGAQAGNLGTTLRQLAVQGASGKPDEALKSFEARFRRLLTCTTARQVCERLPGIIRAASRKAIGINLERLYYDLLYWDEKVKLAWAAAYWGTDASQSAGQGE